MIGARASVDRRLRRRGLPTAVDDTGAAVVNRALPT
jgi:hypothetical protein